ncbi:hypothetical protein PtrM4_112730 [Pyrenophora tritici-repentis]|uniref:BED-type domain-containing protein n=1 Tax=Pyrenophora tritici-repentis TaxID=45151 RepID=A0A834RRI6_9PLEO|nr:hypothetical protein PtrM4_112730 [Pyrenophora tritici-repentis]
MSKPSIECQYFEHVPEHSVAACRECRYAVWPDQIEGHLQKQHKVSYKEAEAVGQQVRSWAGLVQYPSELEVPTGAPKPVRQLPVYTDGMLCQFDSSCCYYVARSKEAIRKHWRKDHQGWSAGKKRGRPSRTRQKSVQAHMDKGYRLVHCQRLFSSRHGSQYFEVQAPSQDGEGPEIVPVDGAAAKNLAQYESLRSRTIKSLTTYLYTIVMEPSTPTSPSPSNIIRLDLTSLTPSPIPTSSPTPILSPTPIQYHESPDEFVQGGITYVKRAIIARKDFRQGTSHIWKYGLQYIRDSDKKEVYYCHECRVGKSKQELFVINGTSRIRNHLEQKHQIDPQSGIKRKGSVRKSIIDQQKDGAASSIFFWKESVEKFKELRIRWIVYCHIAFFQLENQYFRELLLFLNPALLNHLPKAAKTIRSWVMNAFISKKQQLREDLHHSRSRISISFDLWTSPNPYAILGVVAMWIDTTGMRRVTALGMRRIYGEHTGENLGSVVLELLEEYDISGDQIGYFMLDNASANDTAVEFILKDLCPWMKSKQRRHRRLRCLGHVINLCCQAFLMGRNCEKYLAKLEKHHQRGDYTKVEELWKKFGCLGRLHNLVRSQSATIN